MTNLLMLLVAICATEFAHNAIEVWGIRQKLSWLKDAINGKPHGPWCINIDTKYKTAL